MEILTIMKFLVQVAMTRSMVMEVVTHSEDGMVMMQFMEEMAMTT